MSDAVPAESGPARSLITAALATVAVGALALRCAAIAEPLGIDQSLWASAVRGMARGQLLYRDVWEQRPPGIYIIYLTGFRLLGWTAATVAWLDVIAAGATTGLLYLVARPLSSPRTASAAAAFYAALTMPAWLYRHGGFLERSVCETFIVVSVAMCAWCAVRLRDRVTTTEGPAAIDAFALGLFAGGAVVLKPNAGLYFPAVLLWLTLYRRVPLRGLIQPVAIAIAGSIVLPVLTVAWLWHLGLLHDARVAVLDFNRFYVAQGFAPAIYALDFSKAVWLRMKTDPLWLAGGVGSVVVLWDLARTRRLPPLAGLAVVWGGAAALVIVVNGARLFNSYFINAFAPLALLAAWLVFEAARASRLRRAVVLATAALMVILLLQRHYPVKVFGSALDDFNRLRGRTSEETYLDDFGGYGDRRGYSARANAELASYVREHTTPDDRIFLFGINGAGVYFASDRLPAHRFLRVNFFVETYFPDPAFRLDAVTRELAAHPPRYLIFERLNSTSEMGKTVDALPQDPAVVRLLSRYRFETQIEDFTLFIRTE